MLTDRVVASGKSLEEAIENAKKELKVDESRFTYEVKEEGSKGILGFGSKPYIIEAVLKKEEPVEKTKKFVRQVMDAIGIMAEIRVKEDDEAIRVNLTGPKMGLIIGYRGETLDALQYITNLALNRNKDEDYKRIIIDTEGYRAKREDTLRNLAEKTAHKVRKYGRSIKLDPMNPYERRVIHSRLQEFSDITTHSEGEEPFRKVVIELKN